MADNINIRMPVRIDFNSAKRSLEAFISLYERRGINLATNISSINNQLREQGTILGSNGQVISSANNRATDAINRTNDAIENTGRRAQETGRRTTALANNMRTLGDEARSAQSAISVLGKIALWTVLTTAVFAPIKMMKDLIGTIYELDTAIVDLKKVSDELGKSVGIKQFTKDMNEMAREVGHSTASAISSATDFKRLGYSLNEAKTLAEQALVYSNIGDLDIGDATQSIISTLAGFQLGVEDVTHVMDSYNEVGNNFSITSAGIGFSLQRSSSALFEANNSLEESIGLIVAANSSIQNPEKVGNGLKTVAMRIRGISEETGEAIPQLDGLVKRLTGVDMMKDNNTFKSTYDIMVEISKVWKDISDVDRATLLDKLFGKHQGAVGASLLNNMADGIKAMKTATNSLGSSAKEQAEYIDSLQAKVNEFKEAATNLYIDTVNPESLKSIVSLGTKTVDLVDKIGLLNTTIMGLYITLAATGKITAFNTAIKATATALAYTGQATELATRQVINYGAYSTIATRQLHNNIIVLRASTIATRALTVAAKGLKLAFMTLWPLALFEGALLVYRHLKNIEEQAKATNDATSSFDKTLKDFQNTLDPKKIDDLATSLEALKQATDYNNATKRIKELEKAISDLNPTTETEAMSLRSMQEELIKLKNQINPVIDTQKKYDKQKRIATALDYESVQAGNQKIAQKIRENESNRQLIDSYQGVYDKISQGNKLTEEESNLNQKMIDKYPEYTKVLNDKTNAVGINIIALKANQTAEEALAIISFNSMKSKADASSIETNVIIKNTEARIAAMQAEMDFMDGWMEKTGLRDNWYDKSDVSAAMAKANKQLQMAKETKAAWDILANMSIEDLQKGVRVDDDGGGGGGGDGTSTSLSSILTQEQSYLNAITAQENIIKGLTDDQYQIKYNTLGLEKKANQELVDYLESMRSIAKSKGLEAELDEKILRVQGDIQTIEKDRIELARKLADEVVKQQLESFKTLHEEKIKSYEDEISALERQADLENEQEERAKRLLEITKAEQRLTNTLSERNTRIYVEGQGFVWMANPKEVADAQQNIQDLKEDYTSWERDNTTKHHKTMLQDEIKYERDLIATKEKWFSELKLQFQESWKNMELLSDNYLSLFGDNIDAAVSALLNKMGILNGELKGMAGGSSGAVSVGSNGKKTVVASGVDAAILKAQYGDSIKIVEGKGLAGQPGTDRYDTNKMYRDLLGDPKNNISDKDMLKFDSGGETQRTGLHWLDGKPGEPERVLSSEQTVSFNKLANNIIPATNIMDRMMNLIKMPSFTPSLAGMGGKSEVFNIYGNISLPNVKDGNDFTRDLKQRSRLK